VFCCYLAKSLERLTAMATLQQSCVQFQHPQAIAIRGAAGTAELYIEHKKNWPKGKAFSYNDLL